MTATIVASSTVNYVEYKETCLSPVSTVHCKLAQKAVQLEISASVNTFILHVTCDEAGVDDF